MLAQYLLGALRILGDEGVEQALVIVQDTLGLAGLREVQAAQAVQVAAVALLQFPQPGHAGRVVHVAVERLVGVDELLVLAAGVAGALQFDAGLQAQEQRRVGPLRQHLHDFEFERAPQEMRLAGRRDIDAADHCRVLRIDLDQGFFRQPHQRIAYGGLAEAVGVGQRNPRQRRAGGEFQGDDLFAQVFEDLGRRVARAVESELWAGHREARKAGPRKCRRPSVAGFHLADALIH
ncbi:hypothetical protein FQZ97_719410 [compost metagenome]